MNNEERNKDALIAHIFALDTVIRNRNSEIAKLSKQFAELESANNNLPTGDLNLTDVTDVIDRYADRYYNFGVKDTEERIIGLLEEQKVSITVEQFIALIKTKAE